MADTLALGAQCIPLVGVYKPRGSLTLVFLPLMP